MLDLSQLDQFTGTTALYRWSSLFRNVVLTDGTKHVSEEAGAYWLFDAIASYQPKLLRHQDTRLHDFQVWTLTVDQEKRSAVLTCIADTGCKPAVRQEIEYSDFPATEFKLYVTVGQQGEPTVIMLPSEY